MYKFYAPWTESFIRKLLKYPENLDSIVVGSIQRLNIQACHFDKQFEYNVQKIFAYRFSLALLF